MTQSTNSKVPEIRFKGFEGEWEEKRIGNLCDEFHSGKFIRASEIAEIGKYPVYGGNGLRGFAAKYNHDGLYALIGRQGALCGNMNLFSGRAFFTEHAVAVKANEQNDTFFLYYLFGRMNLGQYSSQSAQPGLAVNKLQALHSLVGRKTEQTKIGGYFQEVDRLIELQQRKHEKLVTLKKAMLQKMFPQPGATTPEIRFKGFSGDWESKRIDEIGPLQRGFDLPTTTVRPGPYPVVYSNGILRFHDEYKCVGPGVVTGRSGTIGKVTFVSQNYWPHNTSLWVTNFFQNDPLFIHYFYVQLRLERFNAGSTIPTLNRNDVHAVKVKIPCPAEQHKIGHYFRTLDELISKHTLQLQKLKQLKSACLEKMFV